MPFSTYDTVVGRSSSKLRQPMTTDEWFNLNHVVPLPASIQRPLANSQQLHQLGVRHGVKAPTSDWLIVENQAFGAARQRWELWHLGLTVLMPPGWHSQSLDWNSNQLKRKKERKKNLGISTRLSRLVLNWGGASSCGCIRERTSLPRGKKKVYLTVKRGCLTHAADKSFINLCHNKILLWSLGQCHQVLQRQVVISIKGKDFLASFAPTHTGSFVHWQRRYWHPQWLENTY